MKYLEKKYEEIKKILREVEANDVESDEFGLVCTASLVKHKKSSSETAIATVKASRIDSVREHVRGMSSVFGKSTEGKSFEELVFEVFKLIGHKDDAKENEDALEKELKDILKRYIKSRL